MVELFHTQCGQLFWVVILLAELWLTVDSDDFRHLPRNQGHPTRSRNHGTTKITPPSIRLKKGMIGFSNWHLEKPQERAATIFVIADQLRDEEFRMWIQKLLSKSNYITVACHGLHHRSWSAWGEDIEGFRKALNQAKVEIQGHVGKAWRPWFRAPAGYVAPWMSRVLADEGFTVDTSVNPSFLVRRKAGKGNSWNKVETAMEDVGIVERPWLTSSIGPACGPALHIPILRSFARRAWRQVSKLPLASERSITEVGAEVVTVYWHLHDHARSNGKWTPPLIR